MPATEPVFEARYLDEISVIFDPAGENLEFRDAVQSFLFTPSSSITTTFGGSRNSRWTASSPATWTLAVKFLQDLENADSLQNYLLEHEGEWVTVRFVPSGGVAAEGLVQLLAPPIGGDVGAWLDATQTMGVKGKPTLIPDAA